MSVQGKLKNNLKIQENSLKIVYHNAISQNPAYQFTWDSPDIGY